MTPIKHVCPGQRSTRLPPPEPCTHHVSAMSSRHRPRCACGSLAAMAMPATGSGEYAPDSRSSRAAGLVMCEPADRIPDSYGVGAVLEPGVVLDGAEVAESEAPPAAAGSLKDDPCPAGPVPLAVLARSRVGRPAARPARRRPVPARRCRGGC